MEPNKLENQFREKLSNREINPTENSWDRLDAMLSVSNKPKSNRNWLYIAASFAGFILIGTVLYTKKENAIDSIKNKIVIENDTQKDTSKTEIKSTEKELNYSKIISPQKSKPLVQIQKNNKNNIEKQIVKPQENDIAEIVRNNGTQQITEKPNLIPENIDSLLASADKKSKVEIKKTAIKINSTTLLNQVDGELQVSFREKAFNTISQKYKEAKEALANRNNQ